MKRKFFLIILVFILSVWFLPAQNPFIRQYTTDDGLPSNSIHIIRPDHEKFLWFATDGGLVRYDGLIFKSYNARDGLAQNKVMVIKEDSFNRVWFFCVGRILNYFYQDKIYNSKNAPFLDSLQGNWNFTQDRQGNLYFYAYQSRRITLLDTGNHVKYYWLPSEPTGNNNTITNNGMNILYMTRIPSDEYLIWTPSGIYKSMDLSEKPVKIAHFNRPPFPLGLGDTSMYNVMAYPETGSSIIVKYIDGTPVDTIIFNEAALDHDGMIMEDPEGNVWISSPVKGLYCLKNKKIIFHLDIKDVYWISRDHEGNIWTNSNDGAYKISPYVLSFKHFDNSYFQNESVEALSDNPAGGIWGLYSSTIFLYRNNEFYKKDVSYLNDDFENIDALNHNALLIYDYNYISKCYAISGVSPDIPRKKLIFEKEIPFQWNFNVAGPEFNKNSDVVCIYDFVKQFVTTYSVKNDFKEIDRVPVNKAHHVFYDARDNLVVLEYDKQYILQNKNKIPYREFAELSNSLPVEHITLDSRADVFLSMFDSLYLVKNQEVFNLTSSFDYSFNTPFNRLTYQSPVLYLSTSRNIYACDNPLEISENKAISLHLVDINFSDIRDILAINDSLYIASRDGLTIIPTGLIGQIKTKAPLPYFLSIKINEKEADHYSDGITIKGKNKINFEFGSINYSDNPVLFSYRLEGYEDEWNDGNMNNVVYANLPKGHYKFRLRAGKSNSPWSEPVEYSIIVKATFWQQPLFFAGLIVLIAALVSLLVIRRKNIQLRRRELDNQMITLEQKALQSMMNPHFIFNTLGSIQNYLLLNKPGEAGQYLSRFARLIRMNIGALNSAMINLEEEVNRLKIYLDLEKFRTENKFEYAIEFGQGVEEEDTLIPTMIIQPFVENAIWHGVSALEGMGLIRITFSIHNSKAIKIVIEDNGIGVKQSEIYSTKRDNHLHLSMEMIRKRLEIIGKKMNVNTSMEISEASPGSQNPGTRVILIVPFTLS